MPAFRDVHPLDFKLEDGDVQNAIYIEDASVQRLTLKVTNASGKRIQFWEPYDVPGPAHYHFALRFRPETLSSATLSGTNKMALTSDMAGQWEMADPHKDSRGMDVIYIQYIGNDRDFESGHERSVTFRNVGAAGGQGTRGTKVELLNKEMAYAYDTSKELITNREIHLNVVNHRGKQDIPVQIGFLGSNTVMNDGVTSNQLTLRIANTRIYDPFDPDSNGLVFRASFDDTKRSKIIISFDGGNPEDIWALGPEENIDSIVVSPPVHWTKQQNTQGVKSEWIIYPDSNVILAGKNTPAEEGTNHFDITISNIITNFADGHTHIHIRYENIPGFWDGQVVAVIEKQSWTSRDGKLGVGTALPEATLDVNGEIKSRKYQFTADNKWQGQPIQSSGDHIVTLTPKTDPYGVFNNSQNAFIAPVAGYYFFSAHLTFSNGNGNGDGVIVTICYNGDNGHDNSSMIVIHPGKIRDAIGQSLNAMMDLQAGDKVDIRLQGVDSSRFSISYSSFYGMLLSATGNPQHYQTTSGSQQGMTTLPLTLKGDRIGVHTTNPKATFDIHGDLAINGEVVIDGNRVWKGSMKGLSSSGSGGKAPTVADVFEATADSIFEAVPKPVFELVPGVTSSIPYVRDILRPRRGVAGRVLRTGARVMSSYSPLSIIGGGIRSIFQ